MNEQKAAEERIEYDKYVARGRHVGKQGKIIDGEDDQKQIKQGDEHQERKKKSEKFGQKENVLYIRVVRSLIFANSISVFIKLSLKQQERY